MHHVVVWIGWLDWLVASLEEDYLMKKEEEVERKRVSAAAE